MMRPSDSNQHVGNNHSALEHRNQSFHNTYGPEGYSPNKHSTIDDEMMMNASPDFQLKMAQSP